MATVQFVSMAWSDEDWGRRVWDKTKSKIARMFWPVRHPWAYTWWLNPDWRGDFVGESAWCKQATYIHIYIEVNLDFPFAQVSDFSTYLGAPCITRSQKQRSQDGWALMSCTVDYRKLNCILIGPTGWIRSTIVWRSIGSYPQSAGTFSRCLLDEEIKSVGYEVEQRWNTHKSGIIRDTDTSIRVHCTWPFPILI